MDMVGGIPTPPKNMKVNWDEDVPNIWKKCSKPPTRYTYDYTYVYLYIVMVATCHSPRLLGFLGFLGNQTAATWNLCMMWHVLFWMIP